MKILCKNRTLSQGVSKSKDQINGKFPDRELPNEKIYNTKTRFYLENTVNDVKVIICEKTWENKYYIL